MSNLYTITNNHWTSIQQTVVEPLLSKVWALYNESQFSKTDYIQLSSVPVDRGSIYTNAFRFHEIYLAGENYLLRDEYTTKPFPAGHYIIANNSHPPLKSSDTLYSVDDFIIQATSFASYYVMRYEDGKWIYSFEPNAEEKYGLENTQSYINYNLLFVNNLLANIQRTPGYIFTNDEIHNSENVEWNDINQAMFVQEYTDGEELCIDETFSVQRTKQRLSYSTLFKDRDICQYINELEIHVF